MGCSHEYEPFPTTSYSVDTGFSGDTRTGYPGDPDSEGYPFWIDVPSSITMDLADSERLRLVGLPSRELVPGTWSLEGTRLVFAPDDAALPHGWYAIEVRLEPTWLLGLRDRPYVEPDAEGWIAVRGHVGPRPLLLLQGGVREIGVPNLPESTFYLTASEVIEFDADIALLDHLELTVDGVPGRCWREDGAPSVEFGPDRPFHQVQLACDEARRGAAVRITIDDGFRGIHGPFLNYSGDAPTWEFRAGEPIGHQEPSDRLFAAVMEAHE